MAKDPHVLSTESRQQCECCNKFKICCMYMLQTCEAAWICIDCRKGKKSK